MSALANGYLAAVARLSSTVPVVAATDLEQRLEQVYELGRAAHPGISLEPEKFGAHLAHCGAPLADGIDPACAGDLYLACAALESDAGAVAALQQQCWPRVLKFLRSLRHTKPALEDLRQDLWDALLVGKAGAEPKLRSYSGRGPLANFAGITAQRLALMQIRHDEVGARTAARAAREMTLLSGDAELAFLKASYRDAFKAALSETLEAIDDRSRLILRMYFVDGVSLEAIAKVYGVKQSTISRWMAKLRSSLADGTRARLGERLRLCESEFESLWNLVASQLDISISHVLR